MGKLPSKIFAVVSDFTGSVEYSSNSAKAVEDMYYRIPSSFRSVFSLWEFEPCGSFDKVHLNKKTNRRTTK